MINPHQRFGQRLLLLCKQQWSICTHQWDTEQLSNPQGKKCYCPTACWLVLMPLLEPRKHSMGPNRECCARAQRSPSLGLLCSLLPFHYSTQVRPSFLCADTCYCIKGLLRYLFAFRQTWKATTSAKHSQETRRAGPRAARYKHTPDPRGSTRASVLFNRASEQTAFTNLLMLSTSFSSSARPCLFNC